LDENMIAKLSDFGIARVLEPVGDATQGATQRTTRVQGTLAYLAPEASRGTITVKMDAFALGIVKQYCFALVLVYLLQLLFTVRSFMSC
jgi:interleukin-1 receptor-associated kinase 4